MDIMKRNRYFTLLTMFVILHQATTATAALKVAYYNNTACQNVETTVRTEVRRRFQSDPSIAAQLIRIYFHDCFADSQCDASLLLKKNKVPTVKPELNATSNEGIRGLDFIDYLKKKVVAACVGKKDLVSCADIIALAARDAVALTANRHPYEIPLGRLDGKVSLATRAATLPGSRQRIADIVIRFSLAGFSAEETVILSGGHTLGQTRCKFFDDRLYNWRGIFKAPDPSLNTTTLAFLRKTCTNTTGSKESRVFLDQTPSSSFRFDKSYFTMLTQHKGVLESDQKLLTDPLTKAFVKPLADGSQSNFARKFEAAMIKMGHLGSTTVVGSKGNIRKVCSVLN